MFRVYQYGLQPPTKNEDLVREQLWMAHRYYCDLLEARIKIRDKQRALEQIECPEAVAFAKADQNLEDLLKQQATIKAKTKKAAPKELRAVVKEARALRRETKTKMMEVRKTVRAAQKDAQAVIHDDWLTAQKEIRSKWSAAGLYWGTYLLVEERLNRADGDVPLWDGVNPNDPRFPRWTHEGSVGIQLQQGLFTELLEECQSTKVQLKIRDHARRVDYGAVRVRIGSGEGRSPVWAEWPIKLHRPLPRGANIKWIVVTLRKRGIRDVWTVQITLDMPETTVKEKCGHGVVAVDLGWRIMEGETKSSSRRWGDVDGKIRVAAWRDEFGNNGTLELDPQVIRAIRKPEEIRAIRDINLDELKVELLAEFPEDIPEWVRARTVKREEDLPSSAQARVYINKWKAHNRFHALCRAWEGEVPVWFEEWRYHDFHLREYEAEQRAQALARRKDLYRNFAAWLARTYGTVVIEKFDKRRVARNPNPEDKVNNKVAASSRFLCATSELELSIKHAVSARLGEVVYEDPYRTTQDCPQCSNTDQWWDAAKNIDRRPPCPKCGWDQDQDDSACRVILQRYRERSSGDQNPGGVRETEVLEIVESRYERRARMMREKKARIEALGNGGVND